MKMIEFAAAADSEAKQSTASNEQLLFELANAIDVSNLGDKNFEIGVVETSLSCLISLAKPKRVRVKLVVDHKIVAKLRAILLATNMSVSGVERALKLLETVAVCKEGREEMCGEGVVEAVAGKVLKVSKEATEAAVTVLWSVCCLMRSRRAQEAVAESNGTAKVLLILQSNCSPPVRQMAAELLKVLRVVESASDSGVVCAYSYDTKTTHIMPF